MDIEYVGQDENSGVVNVDQDIDDEDQWMDTE
jgi:hypothetical protein